MAQQFLRQRSTGFVYIWAPEIASDPDMEPYEYPEQRAAREAAERAPKAKGLKAPAQPKPKAVKDLAPGENADLFAGDAEPPAAEPDADDIDAVLSAALEDDGYLKGE